MEQKLANHMNKIDSGNEEDDSVDYDPAADGVTRVKPGDKRGIKEPELVYRSSGGSSSGSSSSKYLQEAETLVSEYDEMIV